MKRNAGLWIDHKEAIIVFIAADGAEETNRVESHMEKHGRFSGRSSGNGAAEDQRDRQFAVHLDKYYDDVIVLLYTAQSILIFGPGEAKGEFRKRLAHKKMDDRVVGVDTTDEMTDREIATKVRDYYKMQPVALD